MIPKFNIFHFPKAGGKSVRHQLQKNENVIMYYNSPMNRSSLRCNLSEYKFKTATKLSRGFWSSNINIAYGHFGYDNRFFKGYNTINIILLRHPIDWAASMYFYWKNKYNIADDILQFIDKYKLPLLYERYLGIDPSSNFSYIIKYEDYDAYLDLLFNVARLDVKNISKNITESKPKSYRDYLCQINIFNSIESKFTKYIDFYENI